MTEVHQPMEVAEEANQGGVFEGTIHSNGLMVCMDYHIERQEPQALLEYNICGLLLGS